MPSTQYDIFDIHNKLVVTYYSRLHVSEFLLHIPMKSYTIETCLVTGDKIRYDN